MNMLERIEKIYFKFAITASANIHNWLESFRNLVESEIDNSVEELKNVGLVQHEETLVYLHYMYFYRFVMPTLETVGCDFISNNPLLVKWQLRNCLMGRFIDDIVDMDSGFWSNEEALFLYSYYLIRCNQISRYFKNESLTKWRITIKNAMNKKFLYKRDNQSNAIICPRTNKIPVSIYFSRIPYFFWLFNEINLSLPMIEWIKKYIASLFYFYDIDDVISDIINNVPTQPSFDIVHSGIDSEGRVKYSKIHKKLSEILNRAYKLLSKCKQEALLNGLEIGPSMIDLEIGSFLNKFSLKKS